MSASMTAAVALSNTTGSESAELNFYHSFLNGEKPVYGRQENRSPTGDGKELRDESATVVLPSAEIIDLPRFRKLPDASGDSLAAVQEWEGTIDCVDGDTVYCTWLNVTAGDVVANEIGEFPRGLIFEKDQDLVVPGAVFRLTIGMLRRSSGQRTNTTEVYFRRFPKNLSKKKTMEFEF